MDPNKKSTRKEFEQKIIEQAWADEAYKERLISHPKEVLEEELKEIDPNFHFGENVNVHIITEDPENIYIVIPTSPKEVGEKVSQSDLETIEGGSILVAALVAVTVAVATNVTAAANANTAANANAAGNVNAVGNANVAYNANATANVNT